MYSALYPVRDRFLSGVSALSLTLLAVAPAQAREPAGSADGVGEIPMITVTAPRLERDLYDTPAAVSVVNRQDLQQGQQGIRLDEALEQVPGLFLQNRNNFAQGLRISSRGFGARAPFGIRGLHIRVDGIPYTLPDGQAQIDAVDLDNAERIEVIRGPSSVLYGNAAGGVLDITTADGTRMQESPILGVQGGSHDLRRASVRLGGEQGRWRHAASVSVLRFDGYRDQSEVDKRQLNARVGYQLDDSRTLSALVNLLDTPVAEDPGGLTAEQAAADPRQAAFFSSALDAGQTVDQQLLGTHYEDRDFAGGKLDIRGFYSWRDFEQQLPFPGPSLIDYRRQYYGGNLTHTRNLSLGDFPLRLQSGLDLAWQEDDRGRRSVDTDGMITGVTQDELQEAYSTGLFLQGELALTQRLGLSAGVRHDRVVMTVDDDFTADGADDSGRRDFREWTGSVGVSYRYRPSHQVYATAGTAFETPTFTEFARPDGGGGFNPDVEPQQALNREVGLRGYFDQGLGYDLALFSVDVDDELVPFEQNGRTFFRNAGETSRDGLELGLDFTPAPAWELSSALTLARYRFDRFEDAGENRTGNDLPGLPRVQWHGSLGWSGLGGLFARFDSHYRGEFYADNANTEEVPGHWRFDLKAGDTWTLGRDTRLRVYGGIRNLLDEDYFENVRINANRGRFYEPAAGRTVFAGLEVGF